MTGWRSDLDGRKVSVLEGPDLDALRADAWFENEAWLDSAATGDRFETRVVTFRDRGRMRAIEITPPRGAPRRIWFDTRTGLIDHVVVRRDASEWAQWPRRWRRTGGRLRWSEQTSADPARAAGRDPAAARFEERVTIDSVTVNPALDPALFAPPRGAAAGVAWSGVRDRLVVPFRYGTRHIWVRVSVNGGPPADFVLDTGSSITVIDRATARRFGLAGRGVLSIQGVNGTAEGRFAVVKSLQVAGEDRGAVTLEGLRVGIVDLAADLEATLWRRPAGILGADVLSRFAVEIDYDAGRVTLHDPGVYRRPAGATGVPMQMIAGVPVVEATLDGACAGAFVVDAGSSFGIRVSGDPRARLRPARCGGEATAGRGLRRRDRGRGSHWLTRLSRARIGPFEWTGSIAGLSLGTRGLAGGSEVAGSIGNRVLERFRCTFDFARRSFDLEPGRRHERAKRTRAAARCSSSRAGASIRRTSCAVRPPTRRGSRRATSCCRSTAARRRPIRPRISIGCSSRDGRARSTR